MSMNTRAIIPVAITVLLSACSGNALFSHNNEYLSVSTIPAGASVFVMQKEQGITPTKINTRLFFPVTFPADRVEDYGRITLKHEGCEDKSLMVNAAMISQGLALKLNCEQGIQSSTVMTESSTISIKKRLKQLQALRDENLISDSEFEKHRQRILQDL
jgi:hypothetical protein